MDGSSILRLLQSKVLLVRITIVGLLMELVCLRTREMVELLLHGSRAELIVEAMDVLLKYLRSLPAEEQAPIAVLLMCLDALVEPNRNNTYKEEAIKTITRSLRCCLSEDTVVPSTRRALLLLGGQFNFSGDLHAEDWMLEHAGFVDHSQATTATSDAVVHALGCLLYRICTEY
ncbi:putative E3 ubiquitin-protein ligase LIN-2 [Zea mays]|uniref:Putative E3 ubiquitin-protein ligase LIN-2 n=1 Tax=Zea mays TaxID=4577 RepID=A0A3L6DJQ8_MAIZE|nr:putative E3 ubiquitin-protein ligase LIN-2 [Zea mays]